MWGLLVTLFYPFRVLSLLLLYCIQPDFEKGKSFLSMCSTQLCIALFFGNTFYSMNAKKVSCIREILPCTEARFYRVGFLSRLFQHFLSGLHTQQLLHGLPWIERMIPLKSVTFHPTQPAGQCFCSPCASRKMTVTKIKCIARVQILLFCD